MGVNSILIPDEGGLIVIIDELKRIKAFGSLMESTITKKDITKKECELGFKLPEALCDLYEIFNPNDPIFSVWLSLVPLEHLSIRVIERELPHTYSCVSFLVNESASYGFAAKYHYSRTGELAQDYMLQEDPPVCSYFTFPKNKKQGMRLNVEEVLLSAMIVSCLGFLQVYTQPSLIGFNDDSSMVSQIELKELWKPFNCFANFDNYNFSVKDSETKSDILATSHLICPISISKYGNAFGAKTDEPLNKLIEENPNLEFVWLRSQSGSNIKEERVFSVPEWRELISIEPILQYLCDFAGLSEKGIVAEIIQKREEKIGGMLPISLKEYYQYMPTSFYHAYNYLRPLQKIKPTKDGKINFLEENQGIYYCAAEVNSPFVYQREKRWGAEWKTWGILDGFLAAEFAWNIAASSEDLGLSLWEFPNFKEEMLEDGGLLELHLNDIAGISQKIAEGNFLQLYQAQGGKVIGIYDCLTPKLYFVAKPKDMDIFAVALGFPVEEGEYED